MGGMGLLPSLEETALGRKGEELEIAVSPGRRQQKQSLTPADQSSQIDSDPVRAASSWGGGVHQGAERSTPGQELSIHVWPLLLKCSRF